MGVAILRAVGIVARRLGAGVMQYRMQARTRRAVTRQYLSLPMEWHQRHPTGELLSNANSDVEAAWGPIAPLPMAVGTVAMMVIAVVQMLFADLVLAVVGLLVFPLVIATNVVYQRLAQGWATRAQELRAELSEIAHESFDGAMVVKTLGREPEETARFRAKATELRDVNIKVGRIRAAFDPTLAALPNIAVLVVLVLGVHRVLSGATDAGDVVTVAYLLTIVSFPIRSIGWLLGEFPRSVVGYRRVDAVLRAKGAMEYGDAPAPTGAGGARLDVDGLRYGYQPDRPLLRERDLRRRARADGRAGRGHRVRQEHAHQPADPPGRRRRRRHPGRRHRPARPGPRCSWPRCSRWCRRRRSCSTTPCAATSRWAPTCPTRTCGPRSGLPRPTASSPPFPTASTRGSASGAPRCPAASGSGSRSPGHWYAGRGSWCSTTPRPPSIPRSRRGSWPGSGPRRSQSGLLDHRKPEGDTTLVVVAYRKATIGLADEVLYLSEGAIVDRGPHDELVARNDDYARLVNAYEQQDHALGEPEEVSAP